MMHCYLLQALPIPGDGSGTVGACVWLMNEVCHIREEFSAPRFTLHEDFSTIRDRIQTSTEMLHRAVSRR